MLTRALLWILYLSRPWRNNMIFKIVLVVLVIILGLIVVLPFVLSMAGFNVLQLGSIGGGMIAAGQGLLRSQDGGENWASATKSTDGRTRFPSEILDLSFHATSSDIIFLGSKGSGLWKSVDGGNSWQKIVDRARVLDPRADVYKIGMSRSQPRIIYLAAFQNNRGRVLKSEDGGESFREVYFVTANRYGVFDVYVDPLDANHVIIVTGQGGVLETRNGGRTWRVKRWFSEALVRLLVNPVFFGEMFVTTSGRNLFKTFDGGENWADLNEGLQQVANARAGLEGRPSSFQPSLNPFAGVSSFGKSLETLVADPNFFTTLYVGSQDGLLRSTNGGFSWERLNLLMPPEALPVKSVAVDPRNSSKIFAAALNQIHKSDDWGVNWSVKTLDVKGRISKILIHPLRPDTMFIVLGR